MFSGKHVLFVDVGKWSPSRCSASALMYTLGVLQLSMAWNWTINEVGYFVVGDVQHFGLSQQTNLLSSGVLKESISVQVTTSLANTIGYVTLNTNLAFDTLWKAIKGSMTKRVRDMIHVLTKHDKEKVHSLLGKEMAEKKSYIPTHEDRQLSKKMAQEWEVRSINIFDRNLKE